MKCETFRILHKLVVNFKIYNNECDNVMDTVVINKLQINTTLRMGLQQQAFSKDIDKLQP